MGIITTAPMVSSEAAEAEIVLRLGVEEVSDGVARTIAGWWASPGRVGHVLASLSTGCEVDLTELLDDIHATRPEAKTEMDNRGLDMLATWAINRER